MSLKLEVGGGSVPFRIFLVHSFTTRKPSSNCPSCGSRDVVCILHMPSDPAQVENWYQDEEIAKSIRRKREGRGMLMLRLRPTTVRASAVEHWSCLGMSPSWCTRVTCSSAGKHRCDRGCAASPVYISLP